MARDVRCRGNTPPGSDVETHDAPCSPEASGPAALDLQEDPLSATTLSGLSGELSGTAAFDATGDRTAMPSWDELVRQHADRVYRLAYR